MSRGELFQRAGRGAVPRETAYRVAPAQVPLRSPTADPIAACSPCPDPAQPESNILRAFACDLGNRELENVLIPRP